MLPSSTVENYLKAIFQAQTSLPRHDALVPMGQLAAALGVVPGTATTMVKALRQETPTASRGDRSAVPNVRRPTQNRRMSALS